MERHYHSRVDENYEWDIRTNKSLVKLTMKQFDHFRQIQINLIANIAGM